MARDPNSTAATDDEQFRKFPYDPKKDERLKLLLEQYVEEIQNSVSQDSAIRDLRQLIQTVTNTATWWIPRLLDFVQPHYDALKDYYEKMEAALKEFYEKMEDSDSGIDLEYHDKKKGSQEYLADILSVLALTTKTPEESVKYWLLGSKGDVASWGHGYVVYLLRELVKEIAKCKREDKNKVPELNKLLLQIMKYHVQENHESGIERVIVLVREEPGCGHSPYDSDCDLGSGKDCDSQNSDSDFWSKYYREFRRLRGERLKSIIDCTKKVGEFDADLVVDGGLRVIRVYGLGFRINRAFNETEEDYHKSVELVTWLARGACDYYNREKGEDHQLVFERLVKAIEIPIQRYYITLAAKGTDGKLKFVRAEVRYGMAVRTMCSIGFTISDPEPFDQAYETMRSRKFVGVKNPFAVEPWKECENVPVSVMIGKILMAGSKVGASDVVCTSPKNLF